MTRTTARLGRLAGALMAGTLVLAGCSDDRSSPAHTGHTTGSSDTPDSPSAGAEADHNAADLTFATGMLPHHESAIEMAELAEGRAADPRVLDLATRIEATQAPEIDTLTGWLTGWLTDRLADRGDDDGSMDHGEQMGGMSAEGMAALMNASGTEFDRLFLTQMIAHHRGATAMARQEAAAGQNADAIALAESIRDSQAGEIAEMQALLTGLGG
jgi:uncharacterized protein (DUF305 family)